VQGTTERRTNTINVLRSFQQALTCPIRLIATEFARKKVYFSKTRCGLNPKNESSAAEDVVTEEFFCYK
jgi:hypothetical protein